MGDSEAAMAEVAAEYAQAAYVSSGYGETGSDGAFTYGAEANSSAQVHGTEAGAVAGDSSLAGSQPAAGYGAPVNGDVGAGAGTNASVENGVAESASGGADADKSEMSPEEDRLWSIVKTNSDFDAWTALIEETEKAAGEKLWKIRKVYDAFLAEFPLCYGYWKKYADHEARLGFMDKVVEVYERAVLGVTYSVDIWLHYCTFCISTYGDPETIRRLFERALAYVGTDYLSCPLWDKYIEYEEMHSEWSHVAMIYTRILEIPNRRLDDYLIRFKALAASRPLSELRTAEEVATAQPAGQDNEGETHPDEPEEALRLGSVGLTEAEELEKYIAVREDIYKKAKEFDYKISDFENAIRRPYFHVRPLNNAELENWHNYLDFMEREGDINKVVKLYERCVIACANYPDYWIRYVSCMEAFQSMDLVNNALDRATQVFVKRQPDIHLFAARFREKSGDITGARAAYQLIHTQITPGLLDAIVKHANMEHRVGNSKDAFSLYEQAIAIEKGKENSQALQILYAQYSRFLLLVCGNHEKAREILSEAIENVPLSKLLLEALIHFESIQSLQKRTDYIDSLVEKFINPSSDNIHVASAAEREELSYIFLEFVDMFGDAQSIVKAEDRHAKLFMPHRSKSDLKKRQAEDYLSSDKSKLAKSYSEGNVPLVGAYATAQNQWLAGYGMQPQAWPPATQAPAQPWNAAVYGQQAAYGTYGGYTSGYTAPQVTAPAPQAAGYAGYPSTYPAQAAPPQQSYAPPTTAAALAPVQQPAAVPQPYYGSYY